MGVNDALRQAQGPRIQAQEPRIQAQGTHCKEKLSHGCLCA